MPTEQTKKTSPDLRPHTLSNADHLSPPIDGLLVFGSGPVINRFTREPASSSSVKTQIGDEDINFWSKTEALAASELIKKGQVRDILVMGGKTGGQEYASEATLIKNVIQSQGVSENHIKLEETSTNTLENLVNILNLYIDNPDSTFSYENLAVLAAHAHLPRVRLLMEFLDIPYKNAFSAEKVVEYVAQENHMPEVVKEIEERLDTNEISRKPWSENDRKAHEKYYDKQLGTEKIDFVRRLKENDVYSRALLENPEYWIMYIGKLRSETRIRKILSRMDPEMLSYQFGIRLDAPIDEVRDKLTAIQRVVPTQMDDLVHEDWPDETQKKLEEWIGKRNNTQAAKQT